MNLNVAYIPPGREPLDLDVMNKMTQQAFGYESFSYWYLFTEPDGPAVLKENVGRLYSAMHGQGAAMRKFFTGPGVMRNYLENGNAEEIKLRPYAQEDQFKRDFIERFTRDGFEGPQCWYKAAVQNCQYQCDSQLPKGVDKVEVPVLYIGATDDAICRPEVLYPSIQAGLLPKLEQAEMIDAGHWIPYEKPQEVAVRIEAWLKRHYK